MPKIPFSERLIRLTIAWLGFPLSLVQMLVSGCEQRRYKPTGWHADIGPRKLHVSVTGQGAPTVILESGMGGCSLDWSLVIPELSNEATVIAYDRAGFGWSESTAGEQQQGEKNSSSRIASNISSVIYCHRLVFQDC